MRQSKQETLFWELYRCKNEQEVDKLIQSRPKAFVSANWHPLGGKSDYFAVVENQQSNPIAALVEKLTNAIDAVLMRRCYEEQIAPRSDEAPRSLVAAIHRFFPEHSDWDLRDPRAEQARSIQILADGTSGNTSIIVYDDGEGQHPERFEDTFLSLLRGNKRAIHFVQGKYNMGGTGAIVFCGKKRYQLIASKRFDDTGKFGFTLIREKPQPDDDADTGSEYQFLKVGGEIPAFAIDELSLGLHRRMFRTGTVIKLYSYQVLGNRHFIRDLMPSVNQHLFEPALPYTIVENPQRYTRTRDDYAHVNFGLRQKLAKSDYVETSFSQAIEDKRFGKLKIFVYVFKAKLEGKSVAETKKSIHDNFFKDGMQIVFTVGGQVHGHWTAEFITRTLKFALLRDYLLIHVDCTGMKSSFRREIFMGSRDRLKKGEATAGMRKKLGEDLKSGQLKGIFRQRRDRLAYDSAEDEDLLKQLSNNLPFDKALQDLIKQTIELDTPGKRKKPKPTKPIPPPEPFEGRRYPSFFDINGKKRGGATVVEIPQGDSKTVTFESDVEDEYFDRTEKPGALELAVMTYKPNDSEGGDRPGTANDISDIFSVTKRSPQDGKIRVVLEPTKDLLVGDEVEIEADLLSSADPDGALTCRFWIMIGEPASKKVLPPKSTPQEAKLGLPKLQRVYRQVEDGNNALTWNKLNDSGISMDRNVIMHPYVNENDELDSIYINMHSQALARYKRKQRNISQEKSLLADRQYISRVYYHTLFLYIISINRKYKVGRINGHDNYDDVEITEYLKDVFASKYADFLLTFETSTLMEELG